MLNSWVTDFINLPIQYFLLVATFYYLTGIRPSMKLLLLNFILIFVPAIILYQTVFWMGIIYLIVGLAVLFFLYERQISSVLFWSIIVVSAIISDHLATSLIFSIVSTLSGWTFTLRLMTFVLIHISIIILISLLLKRYKVNSIKVQWLITVVIIGTLSVFYFNIFRVFKNSNIEVLKANTVFITLYFMLFLLLTVIFIHIYLKSYAIKAKEKEYENFAMYIHSLEQVNNEMQKFRHDYLNVLLSMKGFMDAEDWNGLKKYFTQGILKFEEKTLVSNKILNNLNNIQDLSIKGLLFNKASNAIERDLAISIEVPQFLMSISVDLINLVRILGITIDNAIENCLEDNKKQIQIAILSQEKSEMFIIRNEMKDKVIEINKIFDEYYTTKDTGKGLGLTTVKKIVDQSKNMSLNIWVEDNWFNVELIIKGDYI